MSSDDGIPEPKRLTLLEQAGYGVSAASVTHLITNMDELACSAHKMRTAAIISQDTSGVLMEVSGKVVSLVEKFQMEMSKLLAEATTAFTGHFEGKTDKNAPNPNVQH